MPFFQMASKKIEMAWFSSSRSFVGIRWRYRCWFVGIRHSRSPI